ncbi:MAG: hypothetical protein PF487_00610 [Bacteroidales bacterium]|nr:hypothetical protein [Bacteroidales bacterium]
MKKKILIIVLFIPYFAFAQEKDEKIISADFSGFVRSDFWYQSSENVEALEGLFTLYPANVNLDADGNDINAQSKTNILAFCTRLRSKISGPDIFNAKSSAYVEADFSGTSDVTGIRLRHAFMKLNWEKTELLFGRYWHPLFLTNSFPTVISLNTGAPFQAFNRSPQLRLTYKFNNALNLIAAVVYQSDYANLGPNGKSPEYLKNSGVPDMNLQLHYSSKIISLGIAGNYKILQPATSTSSVLGEFVTDEKISSYALSTNMKINVSKFNFKTALMYGQNMTEHLLLGGYAVSKIDPATGKEEYTPYNHLFYWANATYGKDLKIGMFFGYAKNLGTNKDVVGSVYARGADIDVLYRISPFVTYKTKNLQLSTELEYTNAAYGDINYSNKAQVENAENVDNKTLSFTAVYFF